MAVVVIVEFALFKTTRNGERGRMYVTNGIFEQTPLPHFCLKVVWKKEEGGGGYFWELTVILETEIALLICLHFTVGQCIT